MVSTYDDLTKQMSAATVEIIQISGGGSPV